MVVRVGIYGGGFFCNVTGITYNSVSMTQKWHEGPDNYEINAGYFLLAPDIGTYDIVISLSAVAYAYGGSISFTGVDQTTPLGTAATVATGYSTAATVNVSSASGELVIDNLGVGTGATSLTIGSGQTERWSQSPTSWWGRGSTKAGEATTAMSWTLEATDRWIMDGVSIKPATGGGLSIPIAMFHYQHRIGSGV